MTKSKLKPDRAPVDGFYSDQFSPEELALVAAFVSDANLDDEIWLQRVLNHRLFRFLDEADGDRAIELSTLVKVAGALGAGTTRVARLLRDQQLLSGGASDSLAAAIDSALAEMAAEEGNHL